ncbi:MAG: phosphodiester glycosidase family protein [Chloroflexota bacterium]
MKKKSVRKSCLLGIIIAASLVCAGFFLFFRRAQPSPIEEEIFQGITYTRDVYTSPHLALIHVIKIDLQEPGIRILVTPGNPKVDLPLKGRTTSDFLNDFDLQVAINGDGFTPWHSNTFFDYYPHRGDPVDVIGFAASEGTVYSHDTDKEPSLYFSRTNQARFNTPIGGSYNVISGNLMLVKNGKALRNLGTSPSPRTAVALDRANRHLILVVVDGRQPGYSEGISLSTLAEVLIFHGSYTAMNMDGGGSSTLVVEGLFGNANILNSPVNNGIPGRERVVGNHLGIFAKPLP